jgi:sugar transferase (PEP-CTERM/EpsH1 system associated)
MRILFLTHRVPYPPDKGDRIRSYNIIKLLAQKHSISLMSVSREPVDPKSYEMLRQYCASVDIVEINSKLRTLRSLPYLFSKQPLSLPAFYSRRFHKQVESKLRSKEFDLIYIYSSTMAQYVLDTGPIPKLMDFIDLDSQKWLDYAATSRQPMRAIYSREGTTLRSFEKKVLALCDQSMFTSMTEFRICKQLAPDARAMVLSNGVELKRERQAAGRRNTVVFVGSMDYFPNIDAMLYFTREILPLIRREIPDVHLSIVGRNPTSQVQALSRLKNVTVTGGVEHVDPYLNDAAVSVIPLRIARGIQNKILESMAHGVPVVTSRVALDGIAAKPGRDVLVADEPDSFAEKTVALLRDRKVRDQLAANAFALVQKEYRWEARLEQLEEGINSICRQSN